MSDTDDSRAELAVLRAERDALLAERERAAPLVAAARAYAEARATTRAAFAAWDRSVAPAYDLADAARAAHRAECSALEAFVSATLALHADGGTK